LASLRAYAPVITALAGADSLTGYEGETPIGLQHGIADPNAALHGALAVLAALVERKRSGEGQLIDLSQLESMVSLLGGQLVAAQIDAGRGVREPAGNSDLLVAPHGVYPVAGPDRWIALACLDEAGWQGLARLLGRPAWARDHSLATPEARRHRQGEIDAAITAWSSGLDGWEACEAAQAVGVAAAPLLNTADRFTDEHLWERQDFAPVEHPVVGSEFVYGIPWKLSRTPGAVSSAAPLLGEHTRSVLTTVLGLGGAEVDQLAAGGVLR
jgi:benzylsuccinate CoA-transferase BbsF subunit